MLKQISSKTKNLVGWVPVQWLNNFFKEKKKKIFIYLNAVLVVLSLFELT